MNTCKINPLTESASNAGVTPGSNGGSGGNLLNVPKNGNEDPQQRRIYLILLSTSVTLASAGFALVVYWMFNYRKEVGVSLTNPGQLANLHPILMFFFMFGMNLYAVLLYRTHYSAQKHKLKWTHALLAMSNIVFSLLGVFAMFRAHQMLGMANFYSLHSWIGIITNSLYATQLLAGVFAFLKPSTSHQIRAKLMPWHRFAGAMILIMAALAVVTGICELVIFQDNGDYSKFSPITFIANFAAVFTVLSAVIAVYLLSTPMYLRQPKPDEGLPARLD